MHVFQEVTLTEEGVKGVLIPGPEGFALEAALNGGRLIDTVNEAGRAFPLELSRIPSLPEPRDREAAWAQDFGDLSSRAGALFPQASRMWPASPATSACSPTGSGRTTLRCAGVLLRRERMEQGSWRCHRTPRSRSRRPSTTGVRAGRSAIWSSSPR